MVIRSVATWTKMVRILLYHQSIINDMVNHTYPDLWFPSGSHAVVEVHPSWCPTMAGIALLHEPCILVQRNGGHSHDRSSGYEQD
jgi:hypothetical protein